MKVAILASHPIQYQVPWFRALARKMDIHVYFAHRQTSRQQAEAGFGVEFDWDVDLLTGYPHTFLHNRSRSPSVNHFFGCDTPEIVTYIKQQHFDIFLVLGWYLLSYWQAVLGCHSLRIPVLARGESQLNTKRPIWKKIIKEAVYRFALHQFTGYLAIGIRNREYLLHYGVPRERIFFVPYVVDNNWFRQKAQEVYGERIAFRDLLGLKEDAILTLFVGKFIKKKRPLDLVRALYLLRKFGLDVHGLFIGAGVLKEDIFALAAQLKVPVHNLGFKNQTELPKYYAMADLLVLPSDSRETWGLVVNEAMACGLPAVVSDAVGCVPDLIVPGKTGDFYPMGNVEKLADAVRHMIPLLKTEMVREALKEKMETYSIGSAVTAFEQAIEITVKRRY